MPSDVVVSGIGPLCPFAVGSSSLAGLTSPGDMSARSGPDWFRPETYLGKRGFKYLTPATRYVVAASQLALEDAGLGPEAYRASDRGAFVGTNFGGAAVLASLDEVILNVGADALSPMTAPNFSINLIASHISERYGMTAFNVTLTNPAVAGLEAVILGTRAIRANRAAMVVAGAVEDASVAPEGGLCGLPAGDGGACIVALESDSAVTRRGGKAYVRVGEGSLRFFQPATAETSEGVAELRSILSRELQRVIPDGPRSLCLCSPGWPFAFNRRVEGVIVELLQERGIEVVRHRFTGDALGLVTVIPLLQIAWLASVYEGGLVMATSPLGHIVLLWLSRGGATTSSAEMRHE